jgi:hypothetical protein
MAQLTKQLRVLDAERKIKEALPETWQEFLKSKQTS